MSREACGVGPSESFATAVEAVDDGLREPTLNGDVELVICWGETVLARRYAPGEWTEKDSARLREAALRHDERLYALLRRPSARKARA